MPECETGNLFTRPIIRPLRALVTPLHTGGGMPVALGSADNLSLLFIRPMTPDTEVLPAVIDLLHRDHPALLRQWINAWQFHDVPIDLFIHQWRDLTAHIPRTLATPRAIPPTLRAQLN